MLATRMECSELEAAGQAQYVASAARARRQPLCRTGNPTTTAAGNLSLKKFTTWEMADLYKQLLAGLVLATAKEAFAGAPGVTEIRIVVLRHTPTDACGKIRPEAIMAARLARAALNGVA